MIICLTDGHVVLESKPDGDMLESALINLVLSEEIHLSFGFFRMTLHLFTPPSAVVVKMNEPVIQRCFGQFNIPVGPRCREDPA